MSNTNHTETSEKGFNTLKKYLSSFEEKRSTILVYLINGIRLKGQLHGYDLEKECLFLDGNNTEIPQLVFFHAISTISQSME